MLVTNVFLADDGVNTVLCGSTTACHAWAVERGVVSTSEEADQGQILLQMHPDQHCIVDLGWFTADKAAHTIT